MKQMLIILIALAFVGGAAFLPAGSGPLAPSTNDSLQDGHSSYLVFYPPPAKICKDDKFPVSVGYIREDIDKPFEILAQTNAGTLSKDYWSFPAGAAFGNMNTTLTMKNIGKKEISFETMTDPQALVMNFEVVDCQYELSLKAYEKQKNDLVEWDMSVSGEVDLSSQDMAVKSVGEGFYDLLFFGVIQDEDLKTGSEGLACELANSSFGFGTFDVVGSNVKGGFTLNIEFKETEFGEGVIFHCKDENDQESVIPLFKNQTVNPGNFIDLQPYFSKGVSTYKFQFGESGSGTYTLIKRSKK